jgi:hypothetical protein
MTSNNGLYQSFHVALMVQVEKLEYVMKLSQNR